MKRMSYMKRLLADLAIAESHNREDLVESINATIEKHKEYKHNWYLARKARKSIENA